MELSNYESLCVFLQAVWLSEGVEEDFKCRANIEDFILFTRGIPTRWIFTSCKTGHILRKNKEKLTTSQIVRALKHRVIPKKIKVRDTSAIKIAKLIFNFSGELKYDLVDEGTLTNILKRRSYSRDILAIESYIIPFPVKGCGLFEHYYSHNQNGIEHKTYELIHLPTNQTNYYTFRTEDLLSSLDKSHRNDEIEDLLKTSNKLRSNKTQSDSMNRNTNTSQDKVRNKGPCHDIIKPHILRVVKAIEYYTRSTITNMTVTFQFHSDWTPFITSVTHIRLINVPLEVSRNRELLCSFDLINTTTVSTGIKGLTHPFFNTMSSSSAPAQTSSPQKTSQLGQYFSARKSMTVTIPPASNNQPSDRGGILSADHMIPSTDDILSDPNTDPRLPTHLPSGIKDVRELDIPSEGNYRPRSPLKNEHSADVPSTVTEGVGVEKWGPTSGTLPFVEKLAARLKFEQYLASDRQLEDQLMLKSQPQPSSAPLLWSYGDVSSGAVKGAVPVSVSGRVVTNGDIAKNYRPLSAVSVREYEDRRQSLQEAVLENMKTFNKSPIRTFANSSEQRPSLATKAIRSPRHGTTQTGTAPTDPPHRYMVATEALGSTANFKRLMLGLEDEKPFVPKPRPVITVGRVRSAGSRRSSEGGKRRPVSASSAPAHFSLHSDGSEYGDGDLPVPREICAGDYCTLCETEAHGDSSRLRDKYHQVSSRGSPVHKSTKTPHQITMKSILITRAEERLLEVTIAEEMKRVTVSQLRKHLSVSEALSYCVRRHLEQLRVRCRELAIKAIRDQYTSTVVKILVNGNRNIPRTGGSGVGVVLGQQRPSSAGAIPRIWKSKSDFGSKQKTVSDEVIRGEIDRIYKKLVYNESLGKTNSDKFYQTMPICETCFHVYSHLDTTRFHILRSAKSSLAEYSELNPVENKNFPSENTHTSSEFTGLGTTTGLISPTMLVNGLISLPTAHSPPASWGLHMDFSHEQPLSERISSQADQQAQTSDLSPGEVEARSQPEGVWDLQKLVNARKLESTVSSTSLLNEGSPLSNQRQPALSAAKSSTEGATQSGQDTFELSASHSSAWLPNNLMNLTSSPFQEMLGQKPNNSVTNELMDTFLLSKSGSQSRFQGLDTDASSPFQAFQDIENDTDALMQAQYRQNDVDKDISYTNISMSGITERHNKREMSSDEDEQIEETSRSFDDANEAMELALSNSNSSSNLKHILGGDGHIASSGSSGGAQLAHWVRLMRSASPTFGFRSRPKSEESYGPYRRSLRHLPEDRPATMDAGIEGEDGAEEEDMFFHRHKSEGTLRRPKIVSKRGSSQLSRPKSATGRFSRRNGNSAMKPSPPTFHSRDTLPHRIEESEEEATDRDQEEEENMFFEESKGNDRHENIPMTQRPLSTREVPFSSEREREKGGSSSRNSSPLGKDLQAIYSHTTLPFTPAPYIQTTITPFQKKLSFLSMKRSIVANNHSKSNFKYSDAGDNSILAEPIDAVNQFQNPYIVNSAKSK